MKITEKKLDNGLVVRVVTFPETDLVSCNVIIKTGGRNEKPEEYGISHFLEHVAFKGTKSFPQPGQSTEMIENLGGVVNAWTSEEATCYWNILPEEHLNISLQVLAEQVSALNFDSKEIDKERGPILEEAKRSHDDPYNFMWRHIYDVMWPDQAIGNGILGPEKNIRRFQPEDFVNYQKSKYGAKNMQVCICTSLKPDMVFKTVEKYFNNLPSGSTVNPEPITHNQTKPQIRLSQRDIKQCHIMYGYKTFGSTDPRVPALEVLMNIFSTGMSSILFKEVREKRSAAYAVQGVTSHFSDTGAVILYAGLDTKKTEEVITLIRELTRDLTKKSFSEERVEKAKQFIKGLTLYHLDGVERTAFWYTTKGILEPEGVDPHKYLEAISKVTPQDVLAVAKDVFKPENESLLILGPFSDQEKFAKILDC